VLMVDRYSAYKAMAQVKLGHVKLAFCWAHVRGRAALFASRFGHGMNPLGKWSEAAS